MHRLQIALIVQIATVVAVVVAVVAASQAPMLQRMKIQRRKLVKRQLIAMEQHIVAVAVAAQQQMLRV
jgi:hypothetical protein